MTTQAPSVTASDRPRIHPVYRLHWEEPEQAWMLLFPEGIVKLNESAGQILELCDGMKTRDEIVASLESRFGAKDLTDDVCRFLEVALDKGWIEPSS